MSVEEVMFTLNVSMKFPPRMLSELHYIPFVKKHAFTGRIGWVINLLNYKKDFMF